MNKRDQMWRELVGPELTPLLDAAGDDAARIRERVTDLVEHLPRRMPPLHAVGRIRSGALSAAGPTAAEEVAAIRREAAVRREALDAELVAAQRSARAAPDTGYRLVGFVWESAGLAIGWVAAVVSLVMARAVGADTFRIGTAAAIGGSTALFASIVCAALERRRAASRVISVRTGTSPFYAVLALCWVVGPVTTAVRVLRYDEALDAWTTFGVTASVVAFVVMVGLVISSATTDQLDRGLPAAPPEPGRNRHTAGLNSIEDELREREERVFAALPRAVQDGVLAGELEGIRLLFTAKVLRPVFARGAVLDVRDRHRAVR